MSISIAYPLLQELASRFDLTFDDISHLTPEEILNLESNVPQNIESRKSGYAVTKQNGIRNVYCGKELSDLRLMLTDGYSCDQVCGNPANKGFARGIARVLKDKSEIGKVEKGEILVTAMTTPDFIPAMERAAAFVTDEGGITCHAAIVSRELGKPCIVATGNATKVLKDGDLIEVDANTGIVKKVAK
jgi:phosphohistidine swiveling domain-containing protein